MTKEELRFKLVSAGIREDYYSLNGGLPNEALCLDYTGSWQVYYSERGGKTGLRIFQNENDACDYFYDLIMNTSANPNYLSSGRQ